MLYPLCTAVTFHHFAVSSVTGSPKGTGHGTAVASDAVRVITDREAGLFILTQAIARTCRNTGCILTVETCD